MKVRYLLPLLLLTFLFSVGMFGVGSRKVEAAVNTPCFYYYPDWYKTHPTSDIKISDTKTITIPNDPLKPNILQQIPFRNDINPCGIGDRELYPGNIFVGAGSVPSGLHATIVLRVPLSPWQVT